MLEDAELTMQRLSLAETLRNQDVRRSLDPKRLRELMMATGDYETWNQVDRAIAEDILADSRANRRAKT